MTKTTKSKTAKSKKPRRRAPGGIDALMTAVLRPPSGTPLRLVANAARSAEGAGRN